MKYFLIALLPYSVFAAKDCKTGLEKALESCKAYTCVHNESNELNQFLNTSHNFETKVTVEKLKKNCKVVFHSQWTGDQVCQYPLKHSKGLASFIADLNSSDGIKMYEIMEELSKAKNKHEFHAGSMKMNAIQNAMMQKQINVTEFMKKNPEMAKNINSLCKLDKSKVAKTKLKEHEKIMKEFGAKLEKLQSIVQKKIDKYGL